MDRWGRERNRGDKKLTRLASGSRQASPTTGESETFRGETTIFLGRWLLRVLTLEEVQATPVPLKEEELEPTCAQAPEVKEPRAALPLEEERRCTEEVVAVVVDAVAANAAAIFKSFPMQTSEKFQKPTTQTGQFQKPNSQEANATSEGPNSGSSRPRDADFKLWSA